MFPEIKVLTEDYTTIAQKSQEHNVFYAGWFDRGPVGEIQQISSIYDLKITFGKPTSQNWDIWHQIYNYFLYGNNCIYIARTASEVSEPARSEDCNISAKYPGEYGNLLSVESDGATISVFMNQKLVESLKYGDSSYYIDYDFVGPVKTRLKGGIQGPSSSVQIEDAYNLAESENFDFDFIWCNSEYPNCGISLAQKKYAIAVVDKPIYEPSTICYEGTKTQTSVFNGKSYNIPLIGDFLGLRVSLMNSYGLGESHCKRSYSLMDTPIAKALDIKDLYSKNINTIGKNPNGYYFYSETLTNGSKLTTELILNNLKKDSQAVARYFVFENNDDLTRNDLQKKLIALCEEYKADRNITDYQVVCNEANQPIDPNSMIADVYVRMPGIIECVIITLKATNS